MSETARKIKPINPQSDQQRESLREREAYHDLLSNVGRSCAKLLLLPFILFSGICAGIISGIQTMSQSWNKGIKTLDLR